MTSERLTERSEPALHLRHSVQPLEDAPLESRDEIDRVDKLINVSAASQQIAQRVNSGDIVG